MTYEHPNNYPKLHNAAWPGVVGKGPGAEPPIDLDTMLDLTADAEFEGLRFDGFDLFLYAPHIDIDSSDDQVRQLADKARCGTWRSARSWRLFGDLRAAAPPWATPANRRSS